jgi:NADH:ubiquinone oxidoreductase subunit 2 (subunit N)
MWINEDEPAGSPITLRPAMTLALVIAVLGTLVLGVYPQALFSEAQSAAATLDGISSAVGSR